MRRTFAFEGEEAERLEWMPLDVRRRLDLAGVRLSLAGWQAMSIDARKRLCEAPVESEEDVAAYAETVHALAPADAVTSIAKVPLHARPWTEAGPQVAERARALGVEVELARWARLDDAARYALCRLSDPKKSDAKLRAALAEFGLVS